jgi:hypothetical protein
MFRFLIATVGALLDGEVIFGNNIRDTVGVDPPVDHRRRCQRKITLGGVTKRCSRSIGGTTGPAQIAGTCRRCRSGQHPYSTADLGNKPARRERSIEMERPRSRPNPGTFREPGGANDTSTEQTAPSRRRWALRQRDGPPAVQRSPEHAMSDRPTATPNHAALVRCAHYRSAGTRWPLSPPVPGRHWDSRPVRNVALGARAR